MCSKGFEPKTNKTLDEVIEEEHDLAHRAMRELEEKFNISIDSIKQIGEGHDSKAYLVNGKYIFKIKFSANKKKGYEKEKAIYDFLNENLETDILIDSYKISSLYNENNNITTLEIITHMTKEELEEFWPIYDANLIHIQILSEDKTEYYYNTPLWGDYHEIIIEPKFNEDNSFYYQVTLKAKPRTQEETVYA